MINNSVDSTVVNPRSLRRAVETTMSNQGIRCSEIVNGWGEYTHVVYATTNEWKSKHDAELTDVLSNLLQASIRTSSTRNEDGTYTIAARYTPNKEFIPREVLNNG